MDRQTAAKLRYDQLKKALTDDQKVRKKAGRARIMGLLVLGAWLIAPAFFWKVDLESAARPEFFRKPTPHEAYLLDLSRAEPGGTPLGRDWEAAAYRAIDFPLSVGAAYQEVGFFPSDDPQALGILVHIPEGQRLRLEVEAEGGEPARLFVDMYRAAPDTLRRPVPVRSEEMGEEGWSFDATRTDDYVLRLQPELFTGGRYRVTVQVGAPWVFPVAGAGEVDIGGVFGDPRDGGDREHHGVDIFMPRGTPVLAAADGQVTSVDTTDIGGRVVWQRESDGRHSIYYAHLDQPLVRSGQRLQAGDTVGLVGNTGNARTTPPHLHFGAYRRGPVDPWNLILPAPPEIPVVRVALDALGEEVRVSESGVQLRRSPSARGAVLAELGDEVPMRILAGAGEWYRVLLPSGESGYVAAQYSVVATPNGTQPSNKT
jgi:murein DD-endopeptidase MepM/ murein hydrolase activator NlpD